MNAIVIPLKFGQNTHYVPAYAPRVIYADKENIGVRRLVGVKKILLAKIVAVVLVLMAGSIWVMEVLETIMVEEVEAMETTTEAMEVTLVEVMFLQFLQ